MANSSNTPKPSNRRRTDGAVDRHGADGRPGPKELLSQARDQLSELTGMTAESVTSFQQTEEGWMLEIEVLELARVPDTMSLLATYSVHLDPQGELTGYRRIRRYERGRADLPRPGGR